MKYWSTTFMREIETAFLEREERIKALEKRVEELEGLESEKQKLINLFKSCRDATGYSDTYFRGMYNGIEWARSCLENTEPEYKDSVDKSEQTYELTCAEMTGGGK